jgi:RND family efflux transporter MFP subunit
MSSSKPSSDTLGPTIENQENAIDASHSHPPSSSNPPWLLILGVVILLVGGGLGWRWWTGKQAQGAAAQPAAAQGIPVRLETVRSESIQDFSEFVGSLESRNSVVLKPEIEGRVSQIFVTSGDVVEAGTPLVELSPEKREAEFASVLASVNSARAIRANAASELQALQAERVSAEAEVELQEAEYRRTEMLVNEGARSQQELDIAERDRRAAIAALNAVSERINASRASLAESDSALQQAQANASLASAQLQDATIVAPFSGTVGDIPVKIGDFADSSTTLTTVTQNRALDLRLSIPLERRSSLRQGLRVELADPQGNTLGTGQISFISPQVDVAAQSILAKASFDNLQGLLLDGQYVKARVIWNNSSGVLVPSSAISRLGGQPFVFVAKQQLAEPGQPPMLVAEQREIQLGALQGNKYQVIEGLQPGEKIVVSGILNLSDGAPIAPETPNSGG